MDTLSRIIGRLLIAALVFCTGVASATGVMPTVQPVSVEPVGVAPGGGIQARYTYEMRLPLAAANDAGVTAAANEATYATRLVTIGRATGGGIIDAGVAVGSRAIPWIAAAVTAYELYKWYRDSQTNALMKQGEQVQATSCGVGEPLFTSQWDSQSACSVPALAKKVRDYDTNYYATYPYTAYSNIVITFDGCVPASSGATCTATGNDSADYPGGTTSHDFQTIITWTTGTAVTSDPAFITDPTPVPLADVGQMAEQHPDWWPGMLTDPQTGAPLITPEVAHDMDALKQQIAPEYGVDPQTLTPTNPDADYVHQNPDPRAPTSLPSYCGWATAACDYYKWVEDHWPDKDPKTYTETDCKVPPQCSGDQVMCAVARNTWADKCAVSGDGTDPLPFGQHTVAEVDQGDQEVGDASKLDSSGFGWGTACPFADTSIEFNGQTITIPFQPVCDYGPWMRALILILAALKAAQIIAGLRDVAA
ncbi:hypothetical protein ISP17_13440 [Dyella ginsengisoli]|uniref:TspB protein n=1 Tax=Dyella ginsengisoli TaxID=363848 RepID=A0ABW8JWZ7_9GAMM